jgi:hypothetical protein
MQLNRLIITINIDPFILIMYRSVCYLTVVLLIGAVTADTIQD